MEKSKYQEDFFLLTKNAQNNLQRKKFFFFNIWAVESLEQF